MASPSHTKLPPTPPPSPPNVRRRQRKKPADPFLDLPTNLTSASAPSSPSNDSPEDRDSLFTRLILTPLLSTSFLLSLFLINLFDRLRRSRTSSSSTNPTHPSLLNRLTSTLNPEPYQDPHRTSWVRRDATSSHVGPCDPLLNPRRKEEEKEEHWYLRKKIRKIARLEIGDALEMRGRVMGVMVFVMAVLLLGVLWVLWWVVRRTYEFVGFGHGT
ncbi:hypothetical protein M011DRAFT_456411 [Sporormia fimetaria CBS 119925]|uniref:Uncharacterized protein n=1 Tax=Sporormia fimetaria CBS 119925 TaxID=1340428 RepID=A0A6A6VIJ1_9PLEO|nr:hypothetical protein M011DRAFT_456411 [Sporormia fimetaria CBS 119925]